MRLLSRIMVVLCLVMSAVCCQAQTYTHAIWLPYGGTGNQPGRMQQIGDWPGHVNHNWIKHQIEWGGPNAAIGLHLAWGFWAPDGVMEFDSVDHAVKYDRENNFSLSWCDDRGFSKAWRQYQDRWLVAYVGNMWSKRFAEIPDADFGGFVQRNVRPYIDAKFDALVVDGSGDGIAVPYRLPVAEWPGDTRWRPYPAPTDGPAREDMLLRVLDGIFPHKTGIEATPRRFENWFELQQRDVWLYDIHFRQLHADNSTLTKGYGKDTSYIKGKIHRIVRPNDVSNPQQYLARCKDIVRAGHIPVVYAYYLAAAGIDPEDMLE